MTTVMVIMLMIMITIIIMIVIDNKKDISGIIIMRMRMTKVMRMMIEMMMKTIMGSDCHKSACFSTFLFIFLFISLNYGEDKILIAMIPPSHISSLLHNYLD